MIVEVIIIIIIFQTNRNLQLILLNIEDNVLAMKRNIGILKASYSNIILLDDDCIPEKDFN